MGSLVMGTTMGSSIAIFHGTPHRFQITPGSPQEAPDPVQFIFSLKMTYDGFWGGGPRAFLSSGGAEEKTSS